MEQTTATTPSRLRSVALATVCRRAPSDLVGQPSVGKAIGQAERPNKHILQRAWAAYRRIALQQTTQLSREPELIG
jgi:hypothetical protein